MNRGRMPECSRLTVGQSCAKSTSSTRSHDNGTEESDESRKSPHAKAKGNTLSLLALLCFVSRREMVGLAILTVCNLRGSSRLLGVSVDLKAFAVFGLIHLGLVSFRPVEEIPTRTTG